MQKYFSQLALESDPLKFLRKARISEPVDCAATPPGTRMTQGNPRALAPLRFSYGIPPGTVSFVLGHETEGRLVLVWEGEMLLKGWGRRLPQPPTCITNALRTIH